MGEITIKPNCEYNDHAPRWQRVRNIIDGEAKLKQIDLSRLVKDNCTVDKYQAYYLRPISPSNKSTYNQQRNANYINGARLYNATVKTLSGLMGMIFRSEPVFPDNLASDIEYLLSNVDGSGLDLEQQIQSVASDVIQIGRDGLLVDMPRNDEGAELTRADVNNGFRATIQEYKAESVIDWHESIVNGSKVLDLVVLVEKIECYCDSTRIAREVREQKKVYRLDDEGVTVQIFTESEKGLIESAIIPVFNANNQRRTKIPFTFIGSKNNQPSIDNLPLEPITDINIGHYQESANLAASSFQLSATQPWVASNTFTNIAKDRAKNGGSVSLGEDDLVIVEQGGSFNYATPPENSMCSSIQESYAEQMIALGAQLITQGGGVETAEAARIKRASDVSDLEVISRNIASAYTQCLEWVCEFMGVTYNEDWTIELNTKFFDSAMTPQQLAELVKTWQAGAISKDVLDYNLQMGKVIKADENLEKMNEAIDEDMGGGVGFDDVDIEEVTPE